LVEIKVAKVKIPLFRYFVPPPDFFQVRRGPCLVNIRTQRLIYKTKERKVETSTDKMKKEKMLTKVARTSAALTRALEVSATARWLTARQRK